MNTNEKKKFTVDKQTLRMIIAGFVCFVGVLLFSDFTGVFRTIPFLLLCGFVCEKFLNVSLKFCAVVTFVMNLFLCFVNQRTIAVSFSLGLFSVLMLICGIYVGKLSEIFRNTDKKYVKNKCLRYSALVILAVLVLNFFVCGNPVSFVLGDKSNTEYITKNYKDEVQKKYTLYSPLNFEYRTYIEFEDDTQEKTIVAGRDNERFVCVEEKNTKDGYRDYYEEKMLFYASRNLSSNVAKATDAFEITACDIEFSKDEILDKNSGFEEYESRIGYVVSFYSILEDEKEFLSIVKDCVSVLGNNKAQFCEIVFCAGNAHQILFSTVVTPETKLEDLEKAELVFDEKTVKKYGVTEMTILDYWLNL